MNTYENKLIEKFIKTIDAKPSNTKKLFAIGFAGLNGVGKSFVANKLSEKLGLYVDSSDNTRRFLNEQGFEGVSPAQEMVQKIGPASSSYLYKNKISHIIDADLMKLHQITRKNASDHGAQFFLIHLVCPEDIILKRIEKRSDDILKDSSSNLSRVGKEEYFKRKKLHESLPFPEIFFTIDTSEELDLQLDDLINKLKEEKVV